MKNITTLFIAVLAALTITSCSKKDAPTPSPKHLASVMFINGCVGTTQVKGSYAGKVVDGASAVNLFSNSNYAYIVLDSPSTVQAISFNNVSDNSLLGQTNYLCQDNEHYSAFLGGTQAAPTMMFIKDTYDGMSPGNAKIRFVNLSADVSNVTFMVGNSVVFSGINPAQITPFTEVQATTTSYTAYEPNSPTSTQRVFGLRILEAGKYYTVYYTGTTTGVGNYNLQLSQLVSTGN